MRIILSCVFCFWLILLPLMTDQPSCLVANISAQINNNHDHNNQEVAKLYVEHQPWLYQWLWRKLGCTFQAADLAQDTFVKILNQQ